MKSFNHTKGVHTFQRMSGCEWDDETGEAVIFKQKWDNNREALYRERNNLITICPEMLKNFLNYGRTLLVKPVLPSFYLLQKTPSSPVTCHATGFNPNKVNMVWRKDGAEIHEGVNRGEIIPNNDWTFQMSVDLEISSVRPEDWERYACVFQFSDVNQDIVTKLDKAVIWTNKVSHWDHGITFNRVKSILQIIGGLLSLGLTIAGCFMCNRKRNGAASS
ncbi:major histocompatibility complex class I-related gene protein-like [Pundamilia nyererei]|uniref:Major histocompatibility complex class I-related gene protein-like n=1 Tax=Pundamilia nyererei TaxID=303518 RepID=A0A9Y6MB20_9CICH|nr:PREDICTED: major histocompatibility complex class I-related gene protein-like [Pundamilia nyererei]